MRIFSQLNTSSDCRLSPVSDIVTTTLYLPRDRMALSLARDRGWQINETLIMFVREVCAVRAPADVLGQIAEAIAEYAPTRAAAVSRRHRQAMAPQFREASVT